MKNITLRVVLFLALIGLVPTVRAASLGQSKKGGDPSEHQNRSHWFSSTRVNGAGYLELEPTEAFLQAGSIRQWSILTETLQNLREEKGSKWFKANPLVVVRSPEGGVLWTLDDRRQRASRIGEWNMVRPTPAGASPRTGRLFVYYGFSMRAVPNDGSSTLNLNLNTRLGSYLLRDRLDSALSADFGMTSNSSAAGETTSSALIHLGLMGRYHFPLAKAMAIRGNLGGGFDMSVSGSAGSGGSSSSIQGFALTGLTVGLGRSGALDASLKIGNQVTFLFGLTTFFGPK